MPSERGIQAAVGVVLAFSLLWVVAVSFPDGSQQNLRLNVNGRQYTFDAGRKPSRKKGAVRVLRSVPYSSSELKRMVSRGKVWCTSVRFLMPLQEHGGGVKQENEL